jgi:hypothetical protein
LEDGFMVRDASGRAPQTQYSFAAHGDTGSGGEQYGRFLLKPQSGCETYSPTFNNQPMTIRIIPAKSPDQSGQLTPYRWSADGQNYGDWIRTYPAIKSFGTPGVTMFIHNPADEGGGSLQMSPAWVLYNAITQAVKNRQDQGGWAGTLIGGAGRSAQLPRPTTLGVLQCGIVARLGKQHWPPIGFNPNDSTAIALLTGKTVEALINLLCERREGFAGPDNDYENMYVHGDPVSLQHGRYVTIYKLGEDPRQQQQVQPLYGPASFNVPRPQQQQSNDRDDKGYGVYIEPTWQQMPAAWTSPDMVQAVNNQAKAWDDILNFPTIEEQAREIAPRFPPDMIAYAWRDFPEWIPQSVWNALSNRTQTPVQGFGGQAPQQQYPQQAQPSFGGAQPSFGGAQPSFGGAASLSPVGAAPITNPAYPPQQPMTPYSPQQMMPQQQLPPPVAAFGAPAIPGASSGSYPAATAPAMALPPTQQPVQQQQPGFGLPQPGFFAAQPQPIPQQQPGFGLPQPGFGALQQQQPVQQQPMQQQPMQQPPAWAGGFTNTAAGQAPVTSYTPVQDQSLPTGGIPNVPFDTAPQPMQQPPMQQPPMQQSPMQQPPMQPVDAQQLALERARAAAGRR